MTSHGYYEPVKNSQNIRERKAVRYQSNVSLQDEKKKLSYATYLEYLTHHKWCVPVVHAQTLKRIRNIL